MRVIDIYIPRNFFNCAISTCGSFIADTNDSENWNKIKFPLPKGKWEIHSYNHNYESKIVRLIDRRNIIQRILKL